MTREDPKNLEAEIYIRPFKRLFYTIFLMALVVALAVYDYILHGFDIAFVVLVVLIFTSYKHQIKNFLLPPAHLKLYSNGIEIKGLDLFLTWDEIDVHIDKGLTILINTDKVVYDLPAAWKLGSSKEIVRGMNYIGYKFFFTRAFSNMSYHHFYKNVRRILLDRDMEMSMTPDIAVHTTVEEAEKIAASNRKTPAAKKSTKAAPKKKAPTKKKTTAKKK